MSINVWGVTEAGANFAIPLESAVPADDTIPQVLVWDPVSRQLEYSVALTPATGVFTYGFAYPANTVGAGINNAVRTVDLAAPSGSSLVSYLRAVGQTARTVEDQLDLLYYGVANVLDVSYAGGADPTGVASSSAAFAAAATDKRNVFIPDGDFRLTTEWIMNANQHVFGQGRSSRVYTTTGSLNNGINLIMAYERFNVVIENICVQNTGFGDAFPVAGTFTGMGIPIGLIGCNTSAVRNCWVFDGGGVTASPGINQGSCGIYLSNSTDCQVTGNWVQSGQNGITLDQWYSTLAGGSKASFKLGYNIVSGNNVINMAGRGIAIDDDLTQDGFNQITNNTLKLCSFAGISATFSNYLSILGNSCDGKRTVARTQETTTAACYYGCKTSGLVGAKIENNSFANDLVCAVFAYNPQRSSISHNNLTPDCTDADPEAIGAIGGLCVIATASNSLSGNSFDDNYIRRMGSTGALIPGIRLQIGAVTARHGDSSVSMNKIFNFNGNSIDIPTVSTTKAKRLKVNGNLLNGTGAAAGATGIYSNGVTYSEFLDNTVYEYVTGLVDANGLRNKWTGDVDFCGQGFVHSAMTSNTLAIDFSNITNEAIFGAAATSGRTDAKGCTFLTVGYIKSGVSAAAATNVVLEVPAAGAPTGLAGEIAIGGVGDRVVNSVPTVGQPKAWVCTVAAAPGTWVSEGNL